MMALQVFYMWLDYVYIPWQWWFYDQLSSEREYLSQHHIFRPSLYQNICVWEDYNCLSRLTKLYWHKIYTEVYFRTERHKDNQ